MVIGKLAPDRTLQAGEVHKCYLWAGRTDCVRPAAGMPAKPIQITASFERNVGWRSLGSNECS